eukprot:923858-Pleurochrysis_carterae.AAC.1
MLGSVVYRQTDGGSDNDATITHVLHWLLVHMGVADTPKAEAVHSHSLADRCISMLKEKLRGKKGSGAGCMPPWDVERAVEEALATQTGEAELAWHLAFFDWDAWAKSFD